jgi:p-cumate 2,3-dioxygenase ferredoxin component
MRRVDRADAPAIAVYNVEGTLYATDDLCSHGQSSLTDEGLLEGHVIECGWHRGSFDVRTGEALTAPCEQRLQTYPVELRGDSIFVVIDP